MTTDYLLSWRLAKGYWHNTDAEIEQFEEWRREWEASKASLPHSEGAWRVAMGLPPVKAGRGGERLDRDEVAGRVKLSEFIGRHTQLRHRGDQATGRCPLHDDRLPSLSIDDKKKLWVCHAGCGGGTVFDFVMKRDGVDFRAALRIVNQEV